MPLQDIRDERQLTGLSGRSPTPARSLMSKVNRHDSKGLYPDALIHASVRPICKIHYMVTIGIGLAAVLDIMVACSDPPPRDLR